MPKESDKVLSSENVEIATNIQRRDGWALLMIEQDTQEEREMDDFEDFGARREWTASKHEMNRAEQFIWAIVTPRPTQP